MRWLLVAVTVVAASCRGAEGKRDSSDTARDATAAGAPAVAEGMCSAHGVLEAVCTKCNAKLAAVFRAQGDWCAAHEFPESFCPICHPERGGKPALNVSGDIGADGIASAPVVPADGTRIRFKTEETARLAGIDSVRAVRNTAPSRVSALAHIAYDATRVAHVNARAAGVVRTIHVDVGTRVQRGALLAVIQSAAVGADQAQLVAANSRLEVAETTYARVKDLHDKGIVPQKDVLQARQELDQARADQLGTERALDAVDADGKEGTFSLRSPQSGLITQRNVNTGMSVGTEEMLFEVVDPSRMWAEIEIREADLSVVSVGSPVVLNLDALGEREFTSTIDYIAPAVDPKTRTTRARARLDNPEGVLRANMFGRAHIVTSDARSSVAVPKSAVQRARGVPLVFVRLAVDLYETRRVQLGTSSGDMVGVLSGVRPGEFVVTDGSFLLKTETLKESIGAGCCEIGGK